MFMSVLFTIAKAMKPYKDLKKKGIPVNLQKQLSLKTFTSKDTTIKVQNSKDKRENLKHSQRNQRSFSKENSEI